MSVFSEQAATAREAHQLHFGDQYEYRSDRDSSWEPLTVKFHGQKNDVKKSSTGWTKLVVGMFDIDVSALPNPIIHGQLRAIDSESTYTILEFEKNPADFWTIKAQFAQAGEISRPNLRRD